MSVCKETNQQLRRRYKTACDRSADAWRKMHSFKVGSSQRVRYAKVAKELTEQKVKLELEMRERRLLV